MKHTVHVPLTLFRAACHVAKDEEILDIGRISCIAISNGHIVATDGNIMFYAKLDNVDNDVLIVIGKAYAESFIKKTECGTGLKHCRITYDTELKTGLIEIPHYHNAYEGFNVFINKYIDWQKLIPEQTDFNEFVYFDGRYILKLQEIGGMLGEICIPKVMPTGLKKAANIEFLLSNFPAAKAVLMPRLMDYSSYLYCIEICGEDGEVAEQYPAASAEIAFRAAQRTRRDFTNNPAFSDDHSLFGSCAAWIYPAIWNGSKKEHAEKMFYTEEWFSKPLKQYDNPEKAIAYINATDDCVRCYVGDKSITAHTVEEVTQFFTEYGVSGNA